MRRSLCSIKSGIAVTSTSPQGHINPGFPREITLSSESAGREKNIAGSHFEKTGRRFQITLLPGTEKLCALHWVAGGAHVKTIPHLHIARQGLGAAVRATRARGETPGGLRGPVPSLHRPAGRPGGPRSSRSGSSSADRPGHPSGSATRCNMAVLRCVGDAVVMRELPAGPSSR